ncbi:MAG: hypothetical protein HQL69_01615 [Magnetococcales bacterium]|nr:hypothetical protein [Magnetococcales bacterium]
MPRQETIIQVFVASPSDVAEERLALETVIGELNKSWSYDRGVSLELIKWETHVQPGFGEYPQDVINNQITDQYDIFIGIFWTRAGTKTSQADSGTIEEFDKAYARYKKNNNDIDIMIYFKDAPISPSIIDNEQLSTLKKFKDSLGDLGGLYCMFDSLNDFESLLRSHLSTTIQKWSNKSLLINSEEIPNEEQSDSLDDDFGFFDCIESFESHGSKLHEAISSIAIATQIIGGNIAERAKAIADIGDTSEKKGFNEAKKFVKLSAIDMERYALSLERQLPIFSSSKTGAFDALSNALVVYRDFKVSIDNLESLCSDLNTMIGEATRSRESIMALKNTASTLPRIMTRFNKAKNRVVHMLNQIIDEIDSTIRMAQNILYSISKLKD